jgi:hypothetical protein
MLKWMTRTVPALLLATGLSASAGAAQPASDATAVPATTCCKRGESQAACCKTGPVETLQREVETLGRTVDSLSGRLSNPQQYAIDPLDHGGWW